MLPSLHINDHAILRLTVHEVPRVARGCEHLFGRNLRATREAIISGPCEELPVLAKWMAENEATCVTSIRKKVFGEFIAPPV